MEIFPDYGQFHSVNIHLFCIPLFTSFFILIDSHVSRVGDKISVNIDLRLTDLQNIKRQQQNERPDWSGLDPLDRHIRKLERSIDQVRIRFNV